MVPLIVNAPLRPVHTVKVANSTAMAAFRLVRSTDCDVIGSLALETLSADNVLAERTCGNRNFRDADLHCA